MNLDNVCFDTNTIISYLFFIEPNYTIMQEYINQSEDYFYLTKHILNECDKIVEIKVIIIKQILADAIIFLDEYNNMIFNKNKFIKMFIQQHDFYEYANKSFKKNDVKTVLEEIWKESCDENMDGFNLLKRLRNFDISFKNIINKYKDELYSKCIIIANHINKHEKINHLLEKNNSHKEDNEIILNIYEYYLKHNITFIFITFDNNFYDSLVKCNFKFIKNIYNLQDIRRLINNRTQD